MRYRGLWIAAVGLVAPVLATAQEPAPRGDAVQAVSPVTAILEHRAELGLTAEQVARLEAVDRQLRERIAPVREQIREARGELPRPGARGERGARGQRGQRAPRPMNPEQRAAARARMEAARARMQELRPEMEELRESRREAMDEVREVLTEEQQERLRELMRERRVGPRRPGGMVHRRPGGG